MHPTPSQHGRRKVWIVLPAYNEEQDLPSLLERIAEATEEATQIRSTRR